MKEYPDLLIEVSRGAIFIKLGLVPQTSTFFILMISMSCFSLEVLFDLTGNIFDVPILKFRIHREGKHFLRGAFAFRRSRWNEP